MKRQHDIDAFISQVTDELSCEYGIRENDAKQAVEHYGLRELAANYPNSTFHYPPNYWAEEIHRVQFHEKKMA